MQIDTNKGDWCMFTVMYVSQSLGAKCDVHSKTCEWNISTARSIRRPAELGLKTTIKWHYDDDNKCRWHTLSGCVNDVYLLPIGNGSRGRSTLSSPTRTHTNGTGSWSKRNASVTLPDISPGTATPFALANHVAPFHGRQEFHSYFYCFNSKIEFPRERRN